MKPPPIQEKYATEKTKENSEEIGFLRETRTQYIRSK